MVKVAIDGESLYCDSLGFREAIAKRFGFLACPDDPEKKGPRQYVHVTGNMFLLVPKSNVISPNASPGTRADETLYNK